MPLTTLATEPLPANQSNSLPRTATWACSGLAAITTLAAHRDAKRRSRASKTARAAGNVAGEILDKIMGDGRRTVIITGASSGLGLAASKELACSGKHFVIMACRNFVKAQRAARDAGMPEGSYKVLHLDLAANDSVRQFVRAFRDLGRPLDALVCNAAIYFPNADKLGGGGPRWSADGHELSFASNYLGHFLLCNELLPDLQNSRAKPARCIILGTVTATVNDKELGGQIPPKADLGNLEGLEKGMKHPITMIDGKEFCGAKAYKDSKVCEVMLMRELHRRFHDKTGIVFSSMYPGCIAETALFREHYPLFQVLFPDFHKTVTKAYVSEEEAGKRLAAVVSDPGYVESGSYYSWQGANGTGGSGGTEGSKNTEKTQDWFLNYGSFRTLKVDEIGGEAGDDANCKKLWELSERLVSESVKA